MAFQDVFEIRDDSIDMNAITGKMQRATEQEIAKFNEELFLAELDAIRLEMKEIAQTYIHRNFIFNRMQNRKYTKTLLKIPGFKFLLALVVNIHGLLNHERDSAFLRQNQALQNLIDLIQKR